MNVPTTESRMADAAGGLAIHGLAVTAGTIARRLGGHKAGVGWVAHCPAHDDRHPSLSIHDAQNGKVLVHCHAGCDQQRVIAALRVQGYWNGWWHNKVIYPEPPEPRTERLNRDNEERTKRALCLWNAAMPAADSHVESYLRSRGLVLRLAQTLRIHPALKHPSGGVWPVMIGLVTGVDDAPIAVHRTYLSRDGLGKAPVQPQKMLLGPSRGGALRLASGNELLMVGEGIETCLAAMQATGMPVWAALSASGLRGLNLPAMVREVIVLADGDAPGEAAARDAALRWKREGRRVRIARPPKGLDFNDLLLCGTKLGNGDAA